MTSPSYEQVSPSYAELAAALREALSIAPVDGTQSMHAQKKKLRRVLEQAETSLSSRGEE